MTPSGDRRALPTRERDTDSTVTCEFCGNVLGRVECGAFHMKHGGREVLVGAMAGLLAVSCEDCKRLNRFADVKRFLGGTTIDLEAPGVREVELRGKAN